MNTVSARATKNPKSKEISKAYQGLDTFPPGISSTRPVLAYVGAWSDNRSPWDSTGMSLRSRA